MTASLPDEHTISDLLEDMKDYWRDRDLLVAQGRKQLAMENEVHFPDVSHAEPQKLLMGEFRAFVTERQAQFRPERVVQVIPFGISAEAQARANRLERGINDMLYWSSQKRDAWGKCIVDAFCFESAWERWEPAPYAAWPRLIVGDDGMDEFGRKMLEDPTYDADRERRIYKQSTRKLPLMNEYVPLENCWPAPSGDDLDYVLEYEYRPVRSLGKNPLFDPGAVARIESDIKNRTHDVTREITIVRYCDSEWYAYYALAPGEEITGLDRTKPQDPPGHRRTNGQPVLLHSYRHNVGRPLYNEIFGSFGGWNGSDQSLVAGKIKAMLILAQARDELASQALTIARNTAWGGYKITTSINRPKTGDNGEPNLDGLQGKLGEDIILYPDEKMDPLHPPAPNAYYSDIVNDVIRQFQKIGGSAALYGQQEAGVSTGYQQQLTISRAEGQFARTQQGISRGGANGVYLALDIIKAMGEEVWIMGRSKIRGVPYYEHASINPKDLDPMPMIEVSITAPRPMDYTAALADFRQAVAKIGDGDPAMSYDTAREKLLGMEDAQEEADKIHKQGLENKFWASDMPFQMMTEKIMMRSVQNSTPELSQQAIGDAMTDPSFASQMTAFAQGQMAPDEMGAQPAAPALPSAPPQAENMGVGQGAGGGLPFGQQQPMQTMGRENQLLQQQGGV